MYAKGNGKICGNATENMYKIRKGAVVIEAGSLLSPGSMKKKWNSYEISRLPGHRQAKFPRFQKFVSHREQKIMNFPNSVCLQQQPQQHLLYKNECNYRNPL
jgi:hypothetical protein